MRADMTAGSWSGADMRQAGAAARIPGAVGNAQSDPVPVAIAARVAVGSRGAGLVASGKIFMRSSAGALVCSGTVVKDPTRPGRSNLVWTAAHCLHEGKGGRPMRDVVFVPAFDGNASTEAAMHPLGMWSGIRSIVSPQWVTEGSERGGPVSQFDFGILRVAPPDGGTSLEETVGGALDVGFDVPREQIPSMSVFGYPAGPPFDGTKLHVCRSPLRPTRLSFDASRPTMLAVGCTMTGGSSGGGWISDIPGRGQILVSNTSIGPTPAQWLAGPALGTEALRAFQFLSGALPTR
ncbi:trypsin-like serine peptidase [Kitasatospora sp. NPDC058170]|uniref:trypsin-like serine peptidase n=1 Tax=Kitasatospora sp. NPDC058170 TaxID=3346364 RepID=UPI0036D9D282